MDFSIKICSLWLYLYVQITKPIWKYWYLLFLFHQKYDFFEKMPTLGCIFRVRQNVHMGFLLKIGC